MDDADGAVSLPSGSTKTPGRMAIARAARSEWQAKWPPEVRHVNQNNGRAVNAGVTVFEGYRQLVLPERRLGELLIEGAENGTRDAGKGGDRKSPSANSDGDRPVTQGAETGARTMGGRPKRNESSNGDSFLAPTLADLLQHRCRRRTRKGLRFEWRSLAGVGFWVTAQDAPVFSGKTLAEATLKLAEWCGL